MSERPLGRLENFYRSRTASGFYRNFQVSATYSRSINCKSSLFQNALRKTLLDYPLFACNIFKIEDTKTCIYRPVDQITVEDVVEVDFWPLENGVVSEKFMKHANDDYIFQLYVEKPLFRLIQVSESTLCVLFEHTIADGVVGNYFHEIFLDNLAYVDDPANSDEFLAQYGSVEAGTIFRYSRDMSLIKNPLAPPVEYFMEPYESDYTGGDKAFYSLQNPEGYDTVWPGRSPSAKDGWTLSFKHANLTLDEVKAILLKCREQNVTVTALIEVLLATTLQPVFGESHHTVTKIAVTLRRFIDADLAPEEYRQILSDKKYKIIGTYAHGGLGQRLPPLRLFSWELVKFVNDNLLKTCANRKLLNDMKKYFSSADEFADNTEFFEAAMGKPKVDTTKISNLGLVKVPVHQIPGKEPWTITNMVFAQDVSASAAEFMLNVISTPIGGMNFVFSYFNHGSEEEDFSWVLAQLKQKLLSVVKE